MDRGVLPLNNAEAGISQPNSIAGNYVNNVQVGATAAGVIQVTYANGAPQQANLVLNGAQLLLTPTTAAGSVDWDCGSGAGTPIAAKHLPSACR